MAIVVRILLGAGIGYLVGFSGVGGAAFAIPAMVFLLGIPPVNAIATTFPFAAIVKTFGTVEHHRLGSIDWPSARWLLVGSIPSTVLGVFLLSTLVDHFGDELDAWLEVFIGALLIAGMAARVFLREPHVRINPLSHLPSVSTKSLQGVTTGAILGIVIGATSVGGGSLLIAVLMILYPISAARVVGTSIAISLFLMIVGSFSYLNTGFIDFQLAGYMSLGAVPGVLLGSRMTKRLSNQALTSVVMSVVATAGVSLVLDGLAGIA